MNTKIKILIGEENFQKIQNAKICVAGIGGVGGFVVENLVRSGIQNLCIIDFDVVEETNINRQMPISLRHFSMHSSMQPS